MLFNYETLITKLAHYLSENYPSVTTHTDIFEHAFLRFLGYQFVPEKCQFGDNLQCKNSLSIYLRTPYKLTRSNVVDDLRICAIGKFSAISIEEMDSNSNQESFCVRLSVPYKLIEASISEIFQSINRILADPSKINFYRYSDNHARKFGAGLTIIRIESLIREQLLHYFHVSIDDVWGAIV